MKTLGENIKVLRKANGLTQIELAQQLGITQASVTDYETNKKCPALEKIQKMAELFGVTLDALMGNSEAPVATKKKSIHKNSRSAQMQKHFETLKSEDQKSALKYVKALNSTQK